MYGNLPILKSRPSINYAVIYIYCYTLKMFQLYNKMKNESFLAPNRQAVTCDPYYGTKILFISIRIMASPRMRSQVFGSQMKLLPQ